MYPLGLGVFHTGIEVFGIEYAFGGHEGEGSGIFRLRPGTIIPGLKLRKSLHLGDTTLTWPEVSNLIMEMSLDYTGRSYHLLNRNCNHFSDDFAKRLCGKGIPRWVNRMAAIGAMMPCVVSVEQTGPLVPPNLETYGNNSSSQQAKK